MIAAVVLEVRNGLDAPRPWFVPLGLQDWLGILREPFHRFSFPGMTTTNMIAAPLDRPGVILILLASPWIAARLFALIAGGPAGPPPALDLVAADPLARRRFLAWWSALTAVLLAALPTFLLAGLALLHEVLRWTGR